MTSLILLILTLTSGYLTITAETLEKKLNYVIFSILVDLAWFAWNLAEHQYLWASIWIFISLLDLRAYKNIKDALDSE